MAARLVKMTGRAAAAAAAPALPTTVLARDVTPVRLIRRYKRFLADVLFPGEADQTSQETSPLLSGEETYRQWTVKTVHCPNTGPMTGLLPPLTADDAGPGAPPAPGATTFPAYVSTAPNGGKGRKYPHTLEAIAPEEDGRVLVGVHSAAANRVVGALAAAGALTGCGLPALGTGRAEVPFAKSGAKAAKAGPTSRADFCFQLDGGGTGAGAARELVVEVKSVTLASPPGGGGPRVALFPDTVSVRASRHAADLAAVARSTASTGRAAAALFLIQRGDCASFAPSHACDPAYGAALTSAAADGVLLCALRASIAFQPRPDGGEGGGTLVLTYEGPAPVDLGYGLAEAAAAAASAAAAAKAGGPKAKKARK